MHIHCSKGKKFQITKKSARKLFNVVDYIH